MNTPATRTELFEDCTVTFTADAAAFAALGWAQDELDEAPDSGDRPTMPAPASARLAPLAVTIPCHGDTPVIEPHLAVTVTIPRAPRVPTF